MKKNTACVCQSIGHTNQIVLNNKRKLLEVIGEFKKSQ